MDAACVDKNMLEIAKKLAGKRKCTVVVTGKEDIVAGKGGPYIIKNGDPLMAHVVGTGCMAASAIATFAAVEKDLAYAAAAGLVCFEVAAECAAKLSSGPGTFKEKLFDCIFNLDKKTIDKMQKVEA